jgi:O-antigen/teichoic acid export membrane protein
MKKLQSITGILFAIVFILFAYWQFNDPDPILWVPIYATASYVAFQSYRDQLNSELVIVLLILTTAAGIQLWSEMTAWEGFMTDGLSMKTINQELAREAVGLWIVSFAFALFYIIKRAK